MKTVNVYGPGCAKCNQVAELVKKAIAETGVAAELVKVMDVREIVMAGVMTTPAVSVDGVMKATGRVPTLDEIKGWLTA
jgi:small redox-active disulfide protein 2